jgi:hypothetical protein
MPNNQTLAVPGVKYIGGEIKAAGLSFQVGFAITPNGDVYVYGSGGVPATLVINNPSAYTNWELAIRYGIAGVFGAKLVGVLGESAQTIDQFLDWTRPEVQFDWHAGWGWTPGLGLGQSLDGTSYQYTFGYGFTLPGTTVTVTGGLFFGNIGWNILNLFKMLAAFEREALFPSGPNCFAPGTLIQLADGSEKAIEQIRIGDRVLAFEESDNSFGRLVPRAVTRLFANVTDEWLVLRPLPGVEKAGASAGFREITVTAGHHFLSSDGAFRRIDEILANDGRIVLADGSIVAVTCQRISYSDRTAQLYEQGQIVEFNSAGSVALAAEMKAGWKTYNFEVADLHTYVANGIRVHNASDGVLAFAAGEFSALFGHPFDGSRTDVDLMMGAIVDGRITAYGAYVPLLSDDRYTASAFDFLHDKIVLSADALGYAVSTVHNADGGGRFYTVSDPGNSFNWNREVVAVHPDFIDKIVINDNGTVGSATYYGATLTGEIGSALGSSLGRLLGGNSLVGQVAAGTVLGTIGKEIGNALHYGGTYTLDVAVKDAFGTLGGGSGVGALPSAAIGAVSSLLIGELAKALHLDGFEGGLVTTIGSSVTTQLITNAYGVATGATLPNPLLGGDPIPYTMFTGFDPTSLATNIGGAVGGYLGSTLAGHVMVPHYAEGAIGHSVGSSVGGAIGAFLFSGIPVVGPILGSFLGSFVGGVAGSFLGDLAGNDPEAHGRLVFNTDHRFYPDPTSFWGDHGGDGDTFKHMATYTASTVNALADFAGVQMNATPVTTGHLVMPMTGLQLRYGQDTHDFWINDQTGSFVSLMQNVDDQNDIAPMVDDGIMGLVHRVSLTGGDPLERFAWTSSTAKSPSAFALDLQIAKDYRAYLDDKDMIDLIMAAAPESAFTAGWVTTLLKAHELGLDAQPGNDDFRAGNDTINGTSAHELLVGGAGHDIMNGDGGNDRMRGDAGNDVMRGGVGDDILIGGADADTAVFAGPRAAYTLTDLGNGVVGVAGPDGTDTLVQMERLQFDDQVVTLPLTRDLTTTLSLSGATANIGVRNTGNFATTASAAGIYLSADATVTTADTLLASSAIGAINGGSVDFRSLALAFPGNLTPGTYYLGAIADTAGQVSESDELNNLSTLIAIMLGNNADNTLVGTMANDTQFGLAGNDILNGGYGADALTGGPGADLFVLDATALANAQSGVGFDRIADFDRSSGAFNAAEGDYLGLSGILQTARNNGLPVASIVRAFEAGSGAYLQVDPDGAANGQNWVTIARLEGVRAGNTVNVNLATWEVGGPAITVLRPTAGDFNSDHGSDIFWRTDGGALAIWDMKGTTIAGAGYVHSGPTIVGAPGPDWHILGTGDFDGDGQSDVLWWTDAGNLAVWAMDNTEIKSADYLRSGSAIIGRPAPDWHVVGARDFDGDSKTDVLWRTDNNGPLAIWTMDGTQLKSADFLKLGSTIINLPASWHVAATDDFDGDAKGDILERHDSGALVIWEMNGTQIKPEGGYITMNGASVPAPGPDWHIVSAADFDGDAKADILWHTDSGAVAVWLMDGTVIRGADYARLGGTQINMPASTGWHIERLGDYDGDGKSDILWRHDNGGLAIWEMEGTQIKPEGGYINMNGTAVPAPGPDWHIAKPDYFLM